MAADASTEDGAGEPGDPLEGRPPLAGVAFTAAGIVVLIAAIALIEPLRTGIADALSGDTAALRREIRGLDFGGVLIVLALALAHAVIWYPTEILNAAAGFVYGFWAGLGLLLVGWAINALAAYWIGRHAARPLLWRLVGHERFDRLERLAERGGVMMLLAMRLIPVVPFSLFSIVAGAAHVPLGRFMWTSVVGYIPLTALFVYLGSRLEELSLTDPILWVGAVVLVGLLYLGHRLRYLLHAPENGGR